MVGDENNNMNNKHHLRDNKNNIDNVENLTNNHDNAKFNGDIYIWIKKLQKNCHSTLDLRSEKQH